jgi:hypothetical protein
MRSTWAIPVSPGLVATRPGDRYIADMIAMLRRAATMDESWGAPGPRQAVAPDQRPRSEDVGWTPWVLSKPRLGLRCRFTMLGGPRTSGRAGTRSAYGKDAGALHSRGCRDFSSASTSTQVRMKCYLVAKAVCVAALALALSASSDARPDAGLSWQSPARVVRAGLLGVACPGPTACVAVDRRGGIVATSEPRAARAGDWRVVRRPSGIALRDVACPSVRLCVAVGDAGGIVVSERPTRARSWTTERTGMYSLDAIACPTARLCVAGDAEGDVLTSTTPTRSSSWSLEHIDTGVNYECWHYGTTGPDCQAGLRALSCAPGSAVCAAADDSGHMFVSSAPSKGEWSNSGLAGSLPESASFVSLSCPSVTLCFLANADGDGAQLHPLTSPQPDHDVPIDPSVILSAIDCPSVNLCLVTDNRGSVLQSRDPAASTPHWTSATVDRRRNLIDLACPAASLCVAVDTSGHVVVGADKPRPGAGP